MDVAYSPLNKAGDALIEARREDGHGSSKATPSFVVDSESPIIPFSKTITLANTTVIVGPNSGKSIRLWWYNISANPGNSQNSVVSLRFGTGGVDFYKTALSQYGAATAHSFKAGKSYYQGPVDTALYINCDVAQTIYVNIDYEEV